MLRQQRAGRLRACPKGLLTTALATALHRTAAIKLGANWMAQCCGGLRCGNVQVGHVLQPHGRRVGGSIWSLHAVGRCGVAYTWAHTAHSLARQCMRAPEVHASPRSAYRHIPCAYRHITSAYRHIHCAYRHVPCAYRHVPQAPPCGTLHHARMPAQACILCRLGLQITCPNACLPCNANAMP